MATPFQWNWNPGTIEMPTLNRRVDPRVLAQQQAAAGMAGYRPNSAFTPVQNPAAPGLGPETVGHQEDPYSMGAEKRIQAMAALEQEYRDNETRIAAIEAELRNIGNDDNTLDMQLAINRAQYGDIGNAVGHLNRIQLRNSAERDKASSGSKAVDALAGEIDNAYVMRAGAKGNEISAWDNKIGRLKEQYRKLTGQEYGFASPVKTGQVTNPYDVQTYDQYDSLKESLTDRNGRLSDESTAKLLEILGKLPQGDENTKRRAELRTSTTQEGARKGAADARKKEKEAIDDVFDKYSRFSFAGKNNSITVTAKNGQEVTITYGPNGLMFKSGKTIREKK